MTLLERPSRETFRERSIPVLETKRLALRAPRLKDAKTVAMLANDRRIAENTARIPHPYKLSDAEGFIALANKSGSETVFLITLRDGTIAGACGLMSGEGDIPELGYWLGVPHWGKGYATEAVHAVIDYAFSDLEYESLQAGARVTNPVSRRVLEKCGFQWTGVGLYRISAIKSSAPIDRFRLERGIWHSLKSWGQSPSDARKRTGGSTKTRANASATRRASERAM
jgi:RimJ/RimL family protein N-acetyltransferase